ncbi:MAG: hypothetical protein CO156_02435 [Candidatus Pacebacteria bacterium CG_4_9_14_3_um_filter_40_12]|nr:metal ABC transporter ATP-binding protein [Candidatus Paceibacterota bacterium]PIR63265.1 MAG: hypothetical protein COU64_05240 [Candidatus Pacebacteria bacterium CG10_big_fil_rev_8_21_14_0_10_40_26]PIZ79146.1 MAG: hypothetical protein COY01_01830 [Candidatus Pacebacteria bacterium CG_4_10_14_0_2_um_filter_40_20]PJA68801.1 MAG: hypothetical protein CO156_02435 [Candidatus Pacebacteria bacterium CG_4_9_14_3_um_filter_40_12]PJC42112.1 MAG: hypothetical protein CO041_00540 [Candidatus Pacebacte
MTAITVTNLSVRYPTENSYAIEHVSFSMKKGTVGVLLGPNGSGKSTVIKALLGLVEYEGTVSIVGKHRKNTHGHIGYVPQRYPIDRSIPITLHEFLELGLLNCDHSSKEKEKMILSVLKKVDLIDKKNERIADISGGQVQRLLLARALVHEPEILMLDEPEAGVDVEGERIFYELLTKLAKEDNVTVLLASHEIALVRQFADTVFCIKKNVVCAGKPEQVLTAEVFKQLYGEGIQLFGHAHHT